MIAKIIVSDRTRTGHPAHGRGAARHSDPRHDDQTRFLRALITHPAFAAGEVDTGFIERHLDELIALQAELSAAAPPTPP